ncbi:MAG TPA: histidinol-phosphate transaminase [Candidatus Binataceae bacterium]|nr:histidinol-phosphate transaminase [Candidatus Binataceae bacterium]
MFRAAIDQMAPYRPGEQPRPGQRLIKLNTNENPYPPSPRVRRAIIKAAAGDSLRLYPRPFADDFIAAAARHYRFPRQMILAGNGSDELLAMLFGATLNPGEVVAYSSPTYTLYDTLAAVREATVAPITYSRDFALPFDELVRAKAALTIVCNPNAPSGTLTATRTLARLAEALRPRLLVIDEAYVDFADHNALLLARSTPNVVVLRSLSKSFSLAGMRLGLCFARPDIIEGLIKIKDSYNVSRIAQAAGAAALDDAAWAMRNVERVRATRRATEAALRAIGFEVRPSSANFVLARLDGVDLSNMVGALRRRGILVRYFATPLLYDAIRITIGKPAEMKALLAELKPLITKLRARQSNGAA